MFPVGSQQINKLSFMNSNNNLNIAPNNNQQMDLLDMNFGNENGRNSPNACNNFICTGGNSNNDEQSSIFFSIFTKIESYIKNSTM